ncbi:uridine 5'-monophosphate synthase-like [Athalia rosae]|uniref:uridine 5'-monophosphate synthase-like n=1 Tax=Athalia rosae TaxID=37344 RepID=UPI002033AA64|nr:uridine 5'-monophosphate synthase-like [Athalia rosae]XP_048512307.1 uridine 5'-monophosphate synthase-like [Athalia rosae]
MEDQLKNCAVRLFDVNAVKFGNFVTKAGLQTPVYFDLRVIVSHPSLMVSSFHMRARIFLGYGIHHWQKFQKALSSLLWNLSENSGGATQLCGVPYTALPLATLISVEADMPMLIRRKEVKSYGTKKLIEGEFKEGEICVIVEDVVTTGSSILETAKDLLNEGLKVQEAIVILDREQGGKNNLKINGIRMRSLYTLSSFMGYLLEARKVTLPVVESVSSYLKRTHVPSLSGNDEKSLNRLQLRFEERAKLTKNRAAAKLLDLMSTKETTLCLAVDLIDTDAILELANMAGPHIAVLKTHVDAIENFTSEFPKALRELAEKHNFLIMEDRKFADIGNTVSLQYRNGIYKIANWADFVTAHTLPGYGIIAGLKDGLEGISADRGIFLVTEMSCQGALTLGDYVKSSVVLSKSSNLVAGLVCQANVFADPGLVQLTPGVRLTETTDTLGQRYNTPHSVVHAGADLVVVGRGVTEARDKRSAIVEYKSKLWQAYVERTSS